MREEPRVVVVGAGAIGSSIAGWIAPKYGNLSLLARGETLEVIKNWGLKSYLKGGRLTATALPVHAVGSLAEIELPDVIVITVKNYDLDPTCHDLKAQLGDHEPIVVALQNGVQNQQVLPRYFARVVYGVVCYNAWRDGPGEVGHEPRGYVILGTPANGLQEEARAVAGIFGLGLDCVTTDRLQDAVHCKLVINLANALMTLVGFQRRPIGSFNLLVRMTLKLFWEGIQLLQAAGYHEHSLGSIPSWRSIKVGASLPAFMTSAMYRLNTKKLGLNSMAQDVFGGRATTELETLNGYMLDLARRVKFSTPIDETIYEVAKERFGPDFQLISEQELWGLIEREMRGMKSRDNLQSAARTLQSLTLF
jgi:2-dehydropantoate 2-reductase